MLKTVALPLVLFCVISCQPKAKQEEKPALKDSLMKTYMRLVDSLERFDTNHPSHQELLAYLRDDTDHLEWNIKKENDALYIEGFSHNYGSCFQSPAMESYRFDEAYQFVYSAAFCNQLVNLTVGKRNDTMLLSAYLYNFNFVGDSCISVKIIERSLSEEEWTRFSRGIYHADFWGCNRIKRLPEWLVPP